MGLLYVYLIAWVVGGVLLGARMLLTHREPSTTVPAAGSVPQSSPPGSSSRSLVAAAAALIGFGMFGLLAEGLGFAEGGWTALFAAGGALTFIGCSHLLRSRL